MSGPRLDRLQSWMQAVITGSEVADPGGSQPLGEEQVDDLLTPSTTLSAAERLAIYQRSYHARLLECFHATFPGLRRFLGEALFDHFASDYLRRHPSRSYTLNCLAEDFPRHLVESRSADFEADAERREWSDFVIDLATLERAFLEVYDGPGLEGGPPPDVESLRRLPAAEFLALRPHPAPCLRLFALASPAHEYLVAVHAGREPEIPAPTACHVAMVRVDYRVRFVELGETRHGFLSRFNGGKTVGRVLDESGAGLDPVRLDPAREWLVDGCREGFFADFEFADR